LARREDQDVIDGVAKTGTIRIDAFGRGVFAQRPDASESVAALAELREKVKRYEERYNLSSDRLHAAVASGELTETLDVCDWMIHYDILQYVEGR
jgi:hypothetical protein